MTTIGARRWIGWLLVGAWVWSRSPVSGAGEPLELYEVVRETERLEAVAGGLESVEAYVVQDWLHSLDQTRIYLELTRMEEPLFRPQARMDVQAEQIAGARDLMARALAAEAAGGLPAGRVLAAAVRDRSLVVVRIRPGSDSGLLRVTRYYAARVQAHREKSETFSRALHALPPDPMRDAAGRLPTKQQVHAGVLEGKVPVLAWLRPADEAAVQMQGSGLLVFGPDEVISVNYEGNNGYPWTDELLDVKEALSREHGKVPSEKWPLFKKRHTFHRRLDLAEFVHLKLRPGQFLGFDRPFHRKMPVTARISTAMDPAMVPSGAIGVLIAPGGRSRLIKVDDQGAAFIDRPDKIDLFWGSYTRNELQRGVTEEGVSIGEFPDWAALYFLVTPPR